MGHLRLRFLPLTAQSCQVQQREYLLSVEIIPEHIGLLPGMATLLLGKLSWLSPWNSSGES
jgi:hypothetical protein